MRVFVTGATGFIGSAVVTELLDAGHQVLGLTRSEDGAAALTAAGAQPHRGSIEDLESLTSGAAQADAVIHLAFNHDFSRYLQNCEDDRHVIAALGSVLAGSDRPLIITSGTALAVPVDGQPATEDAETAPSSVVPRAASEEAAAAAGAAGTNVSIVRLPQVHDPRRQGLITYAVALAREKGAFAYIGDGANRWSAAHVSDVARLYRLALEKAERGAIYHAVAEEGVAMRDIAETIGRRLDLPVTSLTQQEAPAYFGWLAEFAGRDMPTSSAITREKLGWTPSGPTLIADLERLEL